MTDYNRLVKAYDIRGQVPAELNEDVARKVGHLFTYLTGASRIVVAHDMRESSPALAKAFIDGAAAQGADVVDAGLGSTDYLYYCSGALDAHGAMITASHNPAGDNGLKLCGPAAAPIGEDSGLAQIRSWLIDDWQPAPDDQAGTVTSQEMLTGYVDHLRSLVDLSGVRPLTVVVDAGNGMAGYTAPAVFEGLPLSIVGLYMELDGTFPNHEANPLKPENVRDLQAKVTEIGADIGLAFDGDADRCFFVDEKGAPVAASAIVGLIAARELQRRPGSSVVHNAITSAAAVETIAEHGGKPIRSKVGHSYMKALMATHDAIFGGEHSGHYYFSDFWRADTGMLAALHVLAALGAEDRPLSQMMASYSRYVASGEINSTVEDATAVMDAVEHTFKQRTDAIGSDHLDGLTVRLDGNRWFNLRPSNTEPLLRLNVETPDDASMESLRDDVLAIVRR